MRAIIAQFPFCAQNNSLDIEAADALYELTQQLSVAARQQRAAARWHASATTNLSRGTPRGKHCGQPPKRIDLRWFSDGTPPALRLRASAWRAL